MRSVGVLAAIVALLAIVAPVVGQERVDVDEAVDPAIRQAIVEALASSSTISTADTLWLRGGETHAGSLVQLGGTLIVEGRVEGDVTAIDTQVYVRPRATITGRLTVYAGGMYGSTMSTIDGGQAWLRDALVASVRGADGGADVVPVERDRGAPLALKGLLGFVPRQYNGVDGLAFGIAVGTPFRPPPRTRFTGGPVFRSARDDVGWDVEIARELGGGKEIGVQTYSITDSGERWHRRAFGNSVWSFLLAEDDRTYFQREGYRLFATLAVDHGLSFGAHWRHDDFETLATELPFSLFGDDEDWVENPAITPGEGRALGGWLRYDARGEGPFATRGVFAEVRYNHWGFGGDFEFDWAHGDVRAYLPTGGGSFASARVLAGGRLGGGPSLDPQFLYRLGGRSTVIGYPPLSETLTGDRMAIAQLRYHQRIPVVTRFFSEGYLVGLLDVADAWFDRDSRAASVGVGGGVAGRHPGGYAGLFVAYGLESEEWKVYATIRPWF